MMNWKIKRDLRRNLRLCMLSLFFGNINFFILYFNFVHNFPLDFEVLLLV
jgi:hypothetical protein